MSGSTSIPVAAVLFDRDDTLIVDVPYNGDPTAVRPLPLAAAALRRARGAGLRTGVVTNQSGLARGLVTIDDVLHVNRRVEDLLGPFDVWRFCPHGPDEGCRCRKPKPGMVLSAAAELGIAPDRVGVIGDIGSDMEAAGAAGARAVLVPTARTRAAEVSAAPCVARDILTAVEILLSPDDSEVSP